MEDSSDYLINVQNSDIYQEDQRVLEGVNFNIKKGEFAYLIGRTGSGKSSLLKTLYADLALKKGDMDVAGFQLNGIKTKEIPHLRRRLGIIFQDFQLFYDRTVAENLEFVMKATGWKSRSEMKIRMSDVLMRVGLESAQSKMPHQLSGGEQQRIVIARSLLNEPSILLADEPTGNLDPKVGESIMKLFQDINRSGTAILMATHNHGFIPQFQGRVLVCDNHQLREQDALSAITI